ncbi:MAG: transposase [Chloroflexota bacterium]
MANRSQLTNEQWERIEPLLPPQKPKTGRPAQDHRTIPNGILWILRTGAPGEICPNDAVMDDSLQTLSGLAEKGSMAESSIRIANASRSTGRTEWGT